MAHVSTLFADLSRHFRTQRMLRFVRVCGVHPGTTVLDVGGNPAIWLLLEESQRPKITYLNMPRAAEPDDDRRRLVFADGRRLPFPNRAFDLVFSNSVIEHVGSAQSQAEFASEVARVGKAYWVQTPNRRFPVEQHLMTPFVHWLPRTWQKHLVPRVTLWGLLTKSTAEERRFYFEHYLNDIQLLDEEAVKQLFPEAAIDRERLLGVTKSLIAVRLG